MPGLAVRFAIVAAIVAAALVAAWLGRRDSSPGHPVVDLTGTGIQDDVVVFTSTECPDCKKVLEALRAGGASFREVTWELEPALMSELGVVGVPLVVVRARSGETVGQLAGVPGGRALATLLAKAGS
jgi:glutaredoxin